ncbi:hypothetical protein HELRODRAFT_95007 [Helobdella robusta]|uniref:Aquaporin n=1 Tax=Helobdella robusta TaxID=6412 RepID=T1G941_HELRO|nr:hypothetical protein HELRODRAFT_95007 [Helobdella robusta]ESN98941.1 hypothetical protein HELRODRAFT_95007 [Helobdella robusta]
MARNSLQDLKSVKFYQALACEFIGTFLLVLVACGSCGRFVVTETEVRTNSTNIVTSKLIPNDLVQISLCFGLSVATIVWSIAHVSGGHINPAVSIAFFVTRKISFIRFILYAAVQTAGAIVGAYILKALTPTGVNDSLGSTLLGSGVSKAGGLFVELFITFVLVFTVFATCDSNRQGFAGSGPLAIGLSIAMCHLWAIPYTGSGMNPARALGSHVASETIKDHPYVWIYWIGPLIGGMIAGLLYDLAFAANAGSSKFAGFFTADYEDENYDSTGQKSLEANLTGIRLKDSV